MQLDTVNLRQKLGEISCDEVWELNRVFGMSNHIILRKWNEPASVLAFPTKPLLFWFAAGKALGFWGYFAKRYNILWFFPGSIMPFAMAALMSWMNQPQQQIQNYYRYLLTKRAATCEYEKNSKQLSSVDLGEIKDLMMRKEKTLYDVEASIVDRICKGSF